MTRKGRASMTQRMILALGFKRARELEIAGELVETGDTTPPKGLKTGGFNAAREFKAFILRGNVVDLAIGVVIGAAFGTLVSSLVRNLVTPMTGIFGRLPDFSALSVRVGHARLRYGSFINDLLTFLIVSVVVFFFVVKPLNRLMARTAVSVGVLERDCPECLSRIPAQARRCRFCATELVRAE